jgi:cytochrome c peroxidase
MVLEPVSNHIEMGMRSPSDLIDRLSQRAYYNELFKNAFGDEEITISRIGTALAGFIRSFQSNSSPFQQEFFGFGQAVLTPLQRQGFELFVDKYDCMSCHDLTSDHGYSEAIGEEFVNIGLDQEYADQGVGALSGNAQDNGKFRIPNLRNIALTAPYMHDGRFATLEEVIGHYNNSIQAHPNLDPRLKELTGEARVMNITPDEQVALIAFMESLTDQNFIRDPKFSDPFK